MHKVKKYIALAVCTAILVSAMPFSSVNVSANTENQVESLKVYDITVYENIGGFEAEKGFIYNMSPRFDVTFTDGSRFENIQHGVDYKDEYIPLTVTTTQYEEPWVVGGTYTATASLGEKSCEFNVTVAENLIEKIEIKDITVYDKIDNSYDNKYYYSPEYDVIFKDGTIYKDNIYSFVYKDQFVSLKYEDNQENWEVGNTYTLTGSLAGVTDTFEVTVAEYPIKSIEYRKAPKTEYLTGECFDLRGAEIRINYKDGNSEDIIIDESVYDSQLVFFESEYLETTGELIYYNSFKEAGKQPATIEMFGTKLNIEVNVLENPAESAELKEVNDELIITIKNSNGSTYDLKMVDIDIGAGDIDRQAGWFFAENMILEATMYYVYNEDNKTYSNVRFEIKDFGSETLMTNEIENSEWMKNCGGLKMNK